MQKMEIIRKKGENGYNYTLEKEDKSLNVECYNNNRDTMMRMSIETVTDFKYVITKEDEVYNAFNNFYLNQSNFKESCSQIYGIDMKQEEDESYTLDFTKCHGVAVIKCPSKIWMRMYHELQSIVPENEIKKSKTKGLVKRLFNV